MAKNFFSTVGAPLIEDNEEEATDGARLGVLASAPVFVKSAQTPLFKEEEDIRESRARRAKVTFAKPKSKTTMTKDPTDNFVKKGNRLEREKQEKMERLEEQVAQVYGSKAYKMLQTLSQKKNKKVVEFCIEEPN